MVQAFLLIIAIGCFASKLALAKPGDVFVLDSVGTKTAKLTNASHTSLELTVDLGDRTQYKSLAIEFYLTVGSFLFKIRAYKALNFVQYKFDNGKDASEPINELETLEIQDDKIFFTGKTAPILLDGDKAKFGWDKQTVTLTLKGPIPKGFKLTAKNAEEIKNPATTPSSGGSGSSQHAIPIILPMFIGPILLIVGL